jgi:chromosome segregation ATPase
VVRVSGVSSRFAQVAMTVKAGSASRSIYMDDRTMAHVERLEERSDAAYRIHAVEGKAAGHRLALQQLEQQTEEKNAYEKLEALQASKADKTPQQQEEIDANLRTMAEKQGRLQNELEDMMLRKQALQAQLEQEEQLLARMQEGGDGA